MRLVAQSAMDIAEGIAGQSFYTDSLAGRSRQSAARAVVDWPQLERTITALVEHGRLIPVDHDTMLRLGVRPYNASRTGRYYLTAADYDAAVERTDRQGREDRRAKLREQAEQSILTEYASVVDDRYHALLRVEGLTPGEG
jgi:hypothetical protein